MTYLQFHKELKGYDYFQNNRPIYKYQMYWKRYMPENILKGKYNITKKDRIR